MILLPESKPVNNLIWTLAEDIARNSTLYFKMSAIIVSPKGKILGYGHNTNKTHPRFGSKNNYMTLHAEGNALFCAEKLGNNVEGSTVYVFRKNWRLAKPCSYCFNLLKKHKISKVIYSSVRK